MDRPFRRRQQPSAAARLRLARVVQEELATTRLRLEESSLRSEVHLHLGQVGEASAALDEQRALLGQLSERVERGVRDAAVEREAEWALANIGHLLDIAPLGDAGFDAAVAELHAAEHPRGLGLRGRLAGVTGMVVPAIVGTALAAAAFVASPVGDGQAEDPVGTVEPAAGRVGTGGPTSTDAEPTTRSATRSDARDAGPRTPGAVEGADLSTSRPSSDRVGGQGDRGRVGAVTGSLVEGLEDVLDEVVEELEDEFEDFDGQEGGESRLQPERRPAEDPPAEDVPTSSDADEAPADEAPADEPSGEEPFAPPAGEGGSVDVLPTEPIEPDVSDADALSVDTADAEAATLDADATTDGLPGG